jgi:acetoacetyl-CoA synthetase
MAACTNPIWVPSATDIALARVTAFAEFAARTYRYRASSYLDLWQRSVANLDDFWEAVWTSFGVQSPSPHRDTRSGAMPHVRWFDGAHVSYVAHLFRGRPADGIAIIDVQEGAGSQRQARHLTWAQLRAEAQALNPQATSPWKISATITSPRGTS